MSASSNPTRLEARISTDLHVPLKRPIEEAEVARLSMEDQLCFAEALMSGPEPSPALKRAFAQHKKLLRSE